MLAHLTPDRIETLVVLWEAFLEESRRLNHDLGAEPDDVDDDDANLSGYSPYVERMLVDTLPEAAALRHAFAALDAGARVELMALVELGRSSAPGEAWARAVAEVQRTGDHNDPALLTDDDALDAFRAGLAALARASG